MARLILLSLLLWLPAAVGASPPRVTVLTLDGEVSPASADYVARGLKRAADDGSRLVVLEIDTPGGLDTAMRDIVKGILASPIPVAAYVYPGGARAASAGTYILYASHIAAMAPGTNLGAATPVAIGLGGPENEPAAPSAKKDAKGSPEASTPSAESGTLTRKQIHDASAYIRSLAQLRSRNVEWAEKAVREAVSLSADEAARLHVVDRVAPDLDDLLKQVQGTHVVVNGATVTLDVAGAEIDTFAPDWRARLLSVIASPSLALVLMMLGVYGLLFEFMSPGYILPGVIGGICLMLALFAFQVLPFTFTGFGLIALGMAFLVAEVFVPTSGALAIGGMVAFVIGAVILFDTDMPGYGVSLSLVLGLAVASAAFALAAVGMAVKARRRPVVTGREGLAGARGEVLADFAGEGWATVHGETWRIRSAVPLARGQRVRVTHIDGLTLDVEPQSTPTKGSVR